MKTVHKSLTLLRPGPGLGLGWVEVHEPKQPHNAQSLYYQTRFHMQHGRGATWADAVAHCELAVHQMWETELRAMGAWTESAAVAAASSAAPESKGG